MDLQIGATPHEIRLITEDGFIADWHLKPADEHLTIFEHPTRLGTFALSMNGHRLASTLLNRQIVLWDLQSGEKIGHSKPFRPH